MKPIHFHIDIFLEIIVTPTRMTQLYLARSSTFIVETVSGMRGLASYSIWQFSVSALNFAHSHSTAMMNPSL
jgi:hypothetical protein